MSNGLSRYTPEIVAFQMATKGRAVYCYVLDGAKGSGGQPMIGMFDPSGARLSREQYLGRCRELARMLRANADQIERDIGDLDDPGDRK